jgi:hypothetical protein
MLLWLPSQSGDFAVCLHVQKKAFLSASAAHSSGRNAEPWCDPSQKGWFFDCPQEHHQ